MRSLHRHRDIRSFCRSRQPGVVLILTLLVLIVLAAITYQITVKLADRRRADDYLVYYQGARYACDSAMKYALATARAIEPNYANRADAPDFSDMFRMNDAQVDEMVKLWAQQISDPNRNANSKAAAQNDLRSLLEGGLSSDDANNADFVKIAMDLLQSRGTTDIKDITIPGPYGAPWPLLMDPVEFEIGKAKVSITIEDENAKLPLVWMTMSEPELKRAKQEVLRVFCSWYDIDEKDVAELQKKLDLVAGIKPFTFASAPAAVAKPATPARPVAGPAPVPASRRGAKSATQPVPTGPKVSVVRPPVRNYADHAKLMACSYMDAGWLTVPLIETASRQEYPMKYLALWGSTQVNINSAPRHVLEAAFAFGGDGDKIAEAIIQQRQIRPFTGVGDFRRQNLAFSSQIQKAEKYITTESNFFTIRITATSGPAKCTATAAVMKKGRQATMITAVFE
jgi:DNA uptake protein ComE-like DNA-binding protein